MPVSNLYRSVPTDEDIEPFHSDLTTTSSSYPPLAQSSTRSSTLESPAKYPGAASDSHKGKWKAQNLERFSRREEDDAAGRHSDPPPPKSLSFCVRFTDGTTEDILDLYVTERETVRDVKKRLRLIRPESLQDGEQRPKRLRLIQLGRILVDGVFLVPYTLQLASNRKKLEQSVGVGDDDGLVGRVGSFVKDAVARSSYDDAIEDPQSRLEKGETSDRKGKGKETAIGDSHESEEQIWLHCSVGDVIEDEQVTNDLPSAEQQTTPLQGFDRLREAGFSEEEVENMRAEFRERRGVQEDQDDVEHQRALEEQWMSGMTGQEEASGDINGTGHYVTLLKGVCVGFFMPFLPIFFFRTQIFSRRMQMAIVLGILINVGYGLLRLLG